MPVVVVVVGGAVVVTLTVHRSPSKPSLHSHVAVFAAPVPAVVQTPPLKQ